MTNKFLSFSLCAKIFRLDAVNANPINSRWRWHRGSENQPMLHRYILWHIGVKLTASDNLEFRFYFHAENLRLRDKKTQPNVDDSKQFSRPSARDGNGLFLLADEKMMKNIFTLYDGRGYVRWHLMKKSDFPLFLSLVSRTEVEVYGTFVFSCMLRRRTIYALPPTMCRLSRASSKRRKTTTQIFRAALFLHHQCCRS